MVRVLFVCLGNICRSPMAESVFAHLVREAGLESEIEVDSAGTGDWHVGDRPHHGTRAILETYGIAEGSRARQIRTNDLDRFDYVVVMDNRNLRDVQELTRRDAAHRTKIKRLMDYAPRATVLEVPDPYYTGGFDEVYRLVRSGCQGLLDLLRREHNL